MPCALEETLIEGKSTKTSLCEKGEVIKQFKQLSLCFVMAYDLLALKLGSNKVVILDGISSIREMKPFLKSLLLIEGARLV